MASGLAMANCRLRHSSSFVAGSHPTYIRLAMKYGTHVTTKLPVVNITTFIAFHLVGLLLLLVVVVVVVVAATVIEVDTVGMLESVPFSAFWVRFGRPAALVQHRERRQRQRLEVARESSSSLKPWSVSDWLAPDRFSSAGLDETGGGTTAAPFVPLAPPRNKRRLPVCTPRSSRDAFFSWLTRRNAFCRIMPYRMMTSRTGSIPATAVRITKPGGANRINQHVRPPSVSPRHPNAGRNPIVAPAAEGQKRQQTLVHNTGGDNQDARTGTGQVALVLQSVHDVKVPIDRYQSHAVHRDQ
uniref:Uncharacterized protein n=1 Tax=Anopheles culicifacies TaxID=139723 RepID=A0A182LS54_9DIPT